MATAETTETRSIGLGLDELTERPEWKLLTAKQRLFVSSYLSSGMETGTYDPEFAARSAYDTSTNARILGYELLANPKIQAVVDLHFGPASREMFLNRLQRRIESGDLTVAQIEGIKILCAARGWTEPENLPRINGYEPKLVRVDSPDYKVGDLITQNGVKFRVTKVDAATGKVLDAEEVL